MNLTFGFPNNPQIEQLTLARRGEVEAAVSRFEQRMSDPDSPVRTSRSVPENTLTSPAQGLAARGGRDYDHFLAGAHTGSEIAEGCQ